MFHCCTAFAAGIEEVSIDKIQIAVDCIVYTAALCSMDLTARSKPSLPLHITLTVEAYIRHS